MKIAGPTLRKRRRIPSNPVLSLRNVIGPVRVEAKSLFPPGQVFYTGFARQALYHGLRLLGILPGQNVLVPSFVCPVVLAPFRELGIEVRIYDLEESLCVTPDVCRKLIDERTRALLVVNYFGFPQQYGALKDFCRDQNLFLLEDNAHGFLSQSEGQLLGGFGDIAIFSMRKTVPIPNGAALVINSVAAQNEMERVQEINGPHESVSTAKFLLVNFLQSCEMAAEVEFVERLRKLVKGRATQPDALNDLQEESSLDGYRARMHPLTHRIMARLDADKLVMTRRAAYQAWCMYLCRWKKVKIVYGNLPDGVCPFRFAVRGDYAGLANELRASGIDCYEWPAPSSAFANVGHYAKVLLIPLFRVPWIE